MRLKNKKRIKIFFLTFALSLLTFSLVLPFSNNIPKRVSAGYNNASYDVTNFNPLIGSTFAVRSSSGLSYTTNIVDLPFLRLNNSAVSNNSFTLGYFDYTDRQEGYEFFCDYFTGHENGVLYSFSSNNIWLPTDYISELEILEQFTYEHAVQGGWSIRYQIEVEYLNYNLEVETLVYLSNTYTSNSSEGTFKSFVSSYPAPYRVNISGNDYSYLKRLRISCFTVLNGGGAISGSFNYTTPELYTLYSIFIDNQTICMTSMITAIQQDISWFDSIVASVNSLVQLEVLPNFSIMNILILAVTIPLTIWLLKAWLGG